MIRILSSLACSAALLLSACETTSSPVSVSDAAPSATESELTILISIDGFRPDYLERGATPVLNGLAETGATGRMQPSFPSKTFPNHYTLITGLRPDHNGMVNNTMEDPAIPGDTFMLSDPRVTSNAAWWEQGTPLWVSAEQQGIRTATLFWPGSDFEIHGERPSDFMPFDQRLPDFARVDQLLRWLDVAESERPEFATLYFDIVDTAGHIYGPDDPRTVSATAQVDASIGRLIEGLETLGIRDTTNLIVVSDHGMAPVSDEQIFSMDTLIDPSLVHYVWIGEFVGLSPLEGHEAEVEAALIGRHDHGECWLKENLPARFEYGSNPRVPAIVCLSDIGWRWETADMQVWRNSGGSHGYDPEHPLMHALFIANGPAIANGVTVDLFDNVSVYPLLAQLTGVEPVANDGDLTQLEDALN